VRVETRSGNLDRPQKNWSAWAPLDASGRVASPSARFLQYRLTLNAGSQGAPPEVREMEVAYMPKNVAPVFEDIDVTPPNYKFAAPTLSLSSSNSITLPALGARRRPTTTPPSISFDALSAGSSSSSSTMSYAKGSIGVRWAVSDANSDEMVFKVEIRGVQERDWKLLRDKVKERFVGWESNTFPDGEYVVRITASDAPANPPDQALTASIESERFAIDNTAPRIAGLAGSRAGDKMTIRWRASDERSVIDKAEYSINGGDWLLVQPTTRLSDAPELQYELTVDASGAASERTIAVRVTDEFHNVAVEKVVVR
jgi:hypothetical protein